VSRIRPACRKIFFFARLDSLVVQTKVLTLESNVNLRIEVPLVLESLLSDRAEQAGVPVESLGVCSLSVCLLLIS
jgi:hypothetical protein